MNALGGSIGGPKTKMDFPNGGYNFFQGNFIRFTSNAPLTISSARLYVGSGGLVNFMVAQLASFDSCTGAYSYYPVSSNTINVYPTTPNPKRGAVTINSPSDTGAVFLLNLPVPTPGDYILIVTSDSQDSATLFRNNAISSNPYPVGLPGVFSITGNSAIDVNNCKDTTLYEQYYYFLYDLRVTLDKCPSPRIPVVATTPVPAVITLNGVLLTSNYASGNQWYLNDSLLAGATNPTDSVVIPGVYKDVITDSVGCMLVSNTVTYSLGSDIGLKATPNPNNGAFKLTFYISNSENVGIQVVNTLGQKIYEADYPNFGGYFDNTIGLGAVSAGMYVLKLQVGDTKYVRKIMVY